MTALFPFPGAKLLGYAQITSLSAAAALTVPAGATYALIQAETQNVRWRDDGTAPTASVGMILVAGADAFGFIQPQLAAMQFIQTTATAKLNVSFYG